MVDKKGMRMKLRNLIIILVLLFSILSQTYAQQDTSKVVFRPSGEVEIICGLGFVRGCCVGLQYHVSDKCSIDGTVGYLLTATYTISANWYLSNENTTGTVSFTAAYLYLRSNIIFNNPSEKLFALCPEIGGDSGFNHGLCFTMKVGPLLLIGDKPPVLFFSIDLGMKVRL
jgi:hypothetical protein